MNRSLTRPALATLAALPVLTGTAAVALLSLRAGPAAAQYALLLPLAYLIGALPWGYVALYLRRGIDIREYGSGRTGVSNALRTAGYRVAGLVLLLDLAKGIAAVLLARLLVGDAGAEVAAGLLALAGHNWPVFLGFRGGRGIAPGLGGLAVMSPVAAAAGVLAFIPTCLLSRYLSLGSIMGVVAAGAALLILALLNGLTPNGYLLYGSVWGYNAFGINPGPYLIYGLLGGGVIIWQHRDNIQRLLQGTERRLGHPATRIQ